MHSLPVIVILTCAVPPSGSKGTAVPPPTETDLADPFLMEKSRSVRIFPSGISLHTDPVAFGPELGMTAGSISPNFVVPPSSFFSPIRMDRGGEASVPPGGDTK